MKDYNSRLTIAANVELFSGYGQLFSEVYSRFMKRGIFCSIRAFSMNEMFGATVPLEMQANIVRSIQPEPWELWIRTPKEIPTPNKKVAIFTMHEWEKLPKETVKVINQSEIVIVPSKWCRDTFTNSGVTKPIYHVPLGFDPLIFQPSPLPKNDIIVFGCAGRIAHGPVRKGIGKTIELFQKSFKHEKDIRLHVKVHPDCELPPINDSRIKITKSHLEWYQLANWFRDIHCFVSCATAEGFGLLQLQALASGRGLVAVNYSGLTDFVDIKNTWVIHHDPAKRTKEEGWPEMTDESIVHAWQTALDDIRQGALSPEKQAKSVHHLTWDQSVRVLTNVLDSHNVITPINAQL